MKGIASSGLLEEKLSQFSDRQIREVMRNLISIQLTEGCSLGCDFCAFEAERGPKDYIRFEFLKMLFERYGEELAQSKPILYHASDPFDYDFEGHTYVDVHTLFEKSAKYSPFVSTAVPRGKEQLILDLLLHRDEVLITERKNQVLEQLAENKRLSEGEFAQQYRNLFEKHETVFEESLVFADNWNYARILSRISVSDVNRARLERTLKERLPQLDPGQQQQVRFKAVPYLDNAVVVTYKLENIAEIRDILGVKEGDEQKINRSPLLYKACCRDQPYVEGEKYPVREGIAYAMALDKGRFILSGDCPVDFADVITTHVQQGDMEQRLYVFEHQDTNTGREPRKTGRYYDHGHDEKSIIGREGTLLTPRGVFNIHLHPITPEIRTGYISEQISPGDLVVTKLRLVKEDRRGTDNDHEEIL